MNWQKSWIRNAQLVVVLCCALILKLHYSIASVNQLRWILQPTTALVELVSGRQFEFESFSGYLSSDRSFLIAGSCAGINFLLTAFLMLSLRRLWRNRSLGISWKFIPVSALVAYLVTLVANTVRISTSLWLQGAPRDIGGLSPNQVHRFEGIFIYFGFLLLLFVVSERLTSEITPLRSSRGRFQQYLFPLSIYYTTTLGMPLANGAYREGSGFWEHSVFVLVTPLVLTLLLSILRFPFPKEFQTKPTIDSRNNTNPATRIYSNIVRVISCDRVRVISWIVRFLTRRLCCVVGIVGHEPTTHSRRDAKQLAHKFESHS